MRRFLRNNGLSLTLLVRFAVIFGAQTVAGYRRANDEREEHGRPQEWYAAHVASPAFLEAVMVNWESEFLQMGVYVLLTAFLFQKGSSESKDPDEHDEDEAEHGRPERVTAVGYTATSQFWFESGPGRAPTRRPVRAAGRAGGGWARAARHRPALGGAAPRSRRPYAGRA